MAGGDARTPGRRGRLVLVLVLLAWSVVVACDGRTLPTPTREDVPWSPGSWEPARRPYAGSGRERALLDLAWAGHPGLDLEPGRPMRRFIVNIDRARSLYFRGMRWSLDGGHRARAVDALSAEVRIVMKDRSAASVPLAASLRVDYHTPWADVREVMTALRAPPVSIANVHWAVASLEPDAWVESRIELEPASEPIDPVAQVAITLGGSSGTDDADVAPVLRIGEEPFTFAAGDPYAAGAANDLANRNWRAISARFEVAKAGGARAAVLTIADRVPWAYVAMAVGTLLDAGIDRVHMAETGYRVSTPSARSVPWHAGDRDPRDWHPALALGVGVAIALALFGLGAWNGRRRGRRSLRNGGVREPGRESRARR